MAQSPENNTNSISKIDLLADTVTLLDVLKAIDEDKERAQAVLGASDADKCSYSKGYMKRQALYACVTCIPFTEDSKPGGICLACSYHCHQGHELIEMYTKRNFRCDCGNGKFPTKCNLEPEKASENEHNSYNHNFYGLYCTCNRPYPDPEEEIEDEMLQCVICEDWYHELHVEAPVPSNNDCYELVCHDCMKKHEFLRSYGSLMYAGTEEDDLFNMDVAENANVAKTEKSNQANFEMERHREIATDEYDHDMREPNNKRLKLEECKLLESYVTERSGAAFFIEGWREELCNCDSCQNMYSAEGLTFLTDEEDTLASYYEKGESRVESNSGGLMRTWSSLDRTAQIEAIHKYNYMKEELKKFLEKFAKDKKVVRVEDIIAFVSAMRDSLSRQDIELPFYCR